MKITKRIVSIILALLLVFGNVSILANAATTETLTVKMKYYREVDGVMEETTKFARGDTVTARLFMDTSFAVNTIFMFMAYPADFMKLDVSKLNSSPGNEQIKYSVMNKNNEDVTSHGFENNIVDGGQSIEYPTPGYSLTEDGGGEYEPYLPKSFFDTHAWFTIGTKANVNALDFDLGTGTEEDPTYGDKYWVSEYTFTIADDADGEGYIYIPQESIMSLGDQEAAVTYVVKNNNGDGALVSDTSNLTHSVNNHTVFKWDGEADDKITLDNTVTFNDGTNSVTSTGYIGDKLAAENIPADPTVSGKVFVGWVPSTVENPTEADVVDTATIVYDYDATTYNALYKSADKVVTVNANYTDVTTNTAAVAPKEFETKVGNTVKIVEKLPETQEENTTYILYSQLPTVPNYEFDVAGTPAENLTFEVTTADAVMNVNYKPVKYTATFEPDNGEKATAITEDYYTEITAPAAPEKENMVFKGWSDGKNTIEAGAKFKLEGNVTYTAVYDKAATTVSLKISLKDVENNNAVVTKEYLKIDTFAGNTVKVVDSVSTMAPTEENVTYVTFAEIPAIKNYVVDKANADNVLEVKAAADGTSELIVWYTADTYTATFNPANGTDATEIKATYFSEVTAPAAPAAAAGQEFTGWKLDGTDTVIAAGDKFTLKGDVSYTAQYKASEYDVTYAYAGDVPEGATAPEATTAKMNETITLTDPAAVEGYTFKGWSVTGADYNAETKTVTVGTTNVAITGTWAKNYTVTYEFAGSGEYPDKVPTSVTAPAAATVNKGDKVVVPENPTADGFNFIEWTVEGATYDSASDSYIVGDGDVTVTGTWEAIDYTYKYYLDDEKTVLFTTKHYAYGDTPAAVDVPNDDTLAAKGFPGWTAIEWDTETTETVTGNLDIVLIKEQYTYWVEFQNKDGEALALNNGEDYIEAYYGDKVNASMVTGDANVEGYTATGEWFILTEEGEAGELASFPHVVKGNVTFISGYEINKHSIIYYADEEGKTVYETIADVPYNTVITADHVPAGTPSKEGHNFGVWTEKVSGSEIADYIGSRMPDGNVYVYPSFTINEYTITWVIDGVEQSAPQTYGEAIVAPAVEDKEGYTFKGWSATENGAVIDDLGTVPANNNSKFYAVFAGDDHVAYTVNKYFMNTNGTYEGVEAVPETLYGVAGENATYTPAAPEGFTFDATQNNVLEGTIAGNGSLELTVYYSRNKVNVTIDNKTEEKYYGEEIEKPAVTPEGDPGYEFDKWVDEDGDPVEFPVTVGTEDIVIKPTFKAKTDTKYTIKTYTMGLDGEYGEAVITEGTGTTDQEATYIAPVIEGFTADKESYTVVVKADDSDVIEVRYSRNKNDLVYTVDGKADTTVPTYYGAAIDGTVQPKAIPDGFEFLGWSTNPVATAPDTEFGTMGDATTTLYAVLKAKTDVKYTVNKYFMNTDGTYEGVEAVPEVLYGETGDEVTYVPGAVEGFTFDATQANVLTGTIAGDGSLELAVYYSRNKVNVTIDNKTEEKYYGEEINEPEAPEAPEGEEFVGWVDEDDKPIEFPVKVGTEDIVIKPDFEPIEYTVEFIVKGMDEAYATGEYPYGSNIVKPEDPTVAGFTFKGWAKTEGGEIVTDLGTVPVNGITFYAILEAKTDTQYTVKKFYMNQTGTDWMTPVDDVRYGTTGATVTLDFAKEAAEGFTIDETNSTKSAVIAGDGNTVLVIYYNRDKQNVTINGKTEEKYYGEEITTPETPDAEPGYEFGGWVDEDNKPVTFPITVGTEDIVIKPVWNKLSYNLTFKDSKGNVISGPTETEFDADITAPEVEDKEGYTFVGWIAEGSGEKFNGKMPAKDVVYVETWNDGNYVQYKLETYIMNINGVYELSTWAYGSALTGSTQYIVAEALPGFAIDADKSVLSAVITGDGNTVLKAYYARNMYKVTFDGANEKQVYFGDALPVVEPAAQTGKTFDKWVVEGTTDAAPATMPANNLALVSTWTDTVYTITYIVEGKIVATDKYIYGADVTAPADPEVEGKKFVEWSPKVPETMPAENLIISAIFDSAIYKVTFVDFDGNAFVEMQVRSGDAIVLPVEQPAKEFYVFNGWLDVPASMPAEDIVIKPDFERVPVVLVPEEGSTTVIDRDNMVIYGLEIFLDEALIDEYLDVEGDGYYTVTPVANGCYGTGTVIEVYDRVTGEKLETFHIVIFGDLNGDARVNAVDSAMASDESLMLTDWSQKQVYRDGQLVDNENYKVYMAMAADVNGKNGRINANDVSDIRDTSLGTVVINQVTGTVDR